jgi:DNA-binding response OmpR family regulator
MRASDEHPHRALRRIAVAARSDMSVAQGDIRLAVIDSDSGFLKVLSKRLEAARWAYRVLSGGVPPDELVAMKLNALLVDVRVLKGDPWEFIDRVGGLLPALGLVVCTADATVAQRVRGLRLGADDWIAKPCHPEEVMARIEAVVRRHDRARGPVDVGPIVAGEVEIRPDRYQAFVSGRSVGLTRREFELLQVLADSPARVIEREDIYQRVWGYAMAHGDRSVDVFVRKLRGKLARQSPGWTYIHTHFGIGYRFEPELAAGESPDLAPATDEPANRDAAEPAASRGEDPASATLDLGTGPGR